MSRIMETVLYAAVTVMAILIIGLNCLQVPPGFKLFGIPVPCNSGLTSQNFGIQLAATILFVLLFAMLFAPVLVVIQGSKSAKGSRRTR